MRCKSLWPQKTRKQSQEMCSLTILRLSRSYPMTMDVAPRCRAGLSKSSEWRKKRSTKMKWVAKRRVCQNICKGQLRRMQSLTIHSPRNISISNSVKQMELSSWVFQILDPPGLQIWVGQKKTKRKKKIKRKKGTKVKILMILPTRLAFRTKSQK